MSRTTKITLFAICSAVLVGFLMYDLIVGDFGYRTFRLIGVIAVAFYILYTVLSKKKKSEL
ncbi:hypothetical protein QRD89_07165 [Halobacillus sp. ACCC02827]|uniref:hypothetical protein n=1 Tax=Halobacillus sp. ACCC02827 TaxID=3052090 RepID=UPI0025701BF1|nr:hypothetical protein [Halobacillus sp. ACCC02827]WJE17124.1 hypothetical protein QRD89_07165 [Halobacillus sp. ACCC02827]